MTQVLFIKSIYVCAIALAYVSLNFLYCIFNFLLSNETHFGRHFVGRTLVALYYIVRSFRFII